jgi:hypothetical protein
MAALGLLWSEPGMAMAAIVSSSSNQWHVCFLFDAVLFL